MQLYLNFIFNIFFEKKNIEYKIIKTSNRMYLNVSGNPNSSLNNINNIKKEIG